MFIVLCFTSPFFIFPHIFMVQIVSNTAMWFFLDFVRNVIYSYFQIFKHLLGMFTDNDSPHQFVKKFYALYIYIYISIYKYHKHLLNTNPFPILLLLLKP